MCIAKSGRWSRKSEGSYGRLPIQTWPWMDMDTDRYGMHMDKGIDTAMANDWGYGYGDVGCMDMGRYGNNHARIWIRTDTDTDRHRRTDIQLGMDMYIWMRTDPNTDIY